MDSDDKISLKQYIDVQVNVLRKEIETAYIAHNIVHAAEQRAVEVERLTHDKLHAAEVKASQGMRDTSRWALQVIPTLLLYVIGLVYFIMWIVRGGHTG